MRILALLFMICFTSLGVKAERVLTREKYNLIIASDTVCAGEDYELTVDLKENKNAVIYIRERPIVISDGKGRVKFRGAAGSYDIKGISKQRLQISVVIGKDSLFEEVTYVVVKPPMSNDIRRVQDSLRFLLSRQEGYKDVQYLSDFKKPYEGYAFAYKLGDDLLRKETGELLVTIIVDPTGKVVKYDIIKNTHKTIPLEKIKKAIESYQLEKDFVYDGNLKFSAVIYIVKGYRSNMILFSEY